MQAHDRSLSQGRRNASEAQAGSTTMDGEADGKKLAFARAHVTEMLISVDSH